MPSDKLLKGAAFDILHHAASGLSFLHPHLARTCRAAGLSSITLDLLSESPLPAGIEADEPSRLSTAALHRRFVEIIGKRGFTVDDIASAEATFHLPCPGSDDYSLPGESKLVTANGRVYTHRLDQYA